MSITRLPGNCLSLYADLLQKVQDSQIGTIGSGSFVSKKINGAKYWYHQVKSANGSRQRYLGKETQELLDRIERAKNERDLLRPLMEERRRLVAMLGVGGAFLEKGRPARILGRMSEVGLFAAGGVLVGSFAFSCYGNMLGVSMSKKLMRTEDMDFSVERTLEIGFHRAILEDLTGVDSTFRRPADINPSAPPFDVISSDGFKVEFLTTKESAADKVSVYIDRFSLHALPLDYMDYLLDQAQPAVVASGAGVLVQVPDPARYALHKLAISQLRPAANQTKAIKDVEQAGSILDVLLEDNPGLVMLAADALKTRSDLMANLVTKGVKRLPLETQSLFSDLIRLPVVEWDTQTGQVRDDSRGYLDTKPAT